MSANQKTVNSSVDLNTLNQLPVAVVLFDNKMVYFVNTLGIKLFKIPKKYHSNFKELSIYNFLNETYHKATKQLALKILKGERFPARELEFKDFKNQPIFIEAISSLVTFNNKKVIQSTFLEINERIKQKNETLKSNQLISQIQKTSKELIFEYAFLPKPQLKYISAGSENILGFTQQQLYKNPALLKNMMQGDDKKLHVKTKSDYLKVKKQIKKDTLILKFKLVNGTVKWLQSTATPILDVKKQIIGLVGKITDVTEAVEIKNLLEETKQKFDLITQNGNDVISFYTYYPLEKYLYVSPNIKKILGYDAKELLNDHEFFNKRTEDFSGEFKKIDSYLRINQRKTIIKNHLYVYKTLKKNNEEVWIENNLAPILNANGKIAFYINIYRDITLQKEKEIELEKQKLNYQKLLDVTPTGYLIHNDGVCLYCNSALLKILKLKTHKQIIGKLATEFVVERHRKRIFERIKEILSGIDVNKPLYYHLIDANKKEVEVEIVSTTINYKNQLCIVSLINNISHQKEQERQRLTIEITEKNNKLLQEEIKYREKIQISLTEKTAHLTSILENSTHLIWTINKNHQTTSYNQNFNKLVSKKYKIKFKQGDVILDKIINPKIKKTYKDYWYSKYQTAFNGKKIEFERKEKQKSGESIYRKIFVNPIFNSKNQVIEISCIAHDITDTKIYEQKLISQSAKLNAIFESGSQALWTINRNREITSHNKNYEMAVFNLHSAKPIVGKSLYSKEVGLKSNLDVYATLWDEHYAIAFNGKSTEFITERLNKDDSKVIRQIYLQPIFNQNNEVEEVSGIAHDITDKKLSEQKALNQAAKLNSIFDSSNHYIWTIDNQQKLTSFNKNYFDLIESLYNTKPYVGFSLNRGVLNNDTHYNELLAYHYKKAFLGISSTFEIEALDKEQNKLYLEVFLNPILNNNEIVEVSGIAHNITDKKISQQKIEQSLKEKEILLKEVHHRVKNNMQVISSILNLQSSYVSDEYALTLLKESQNRIKTMAYIHESLYQNKSFTSVNFSDYIETLTKNIIQSYAISSQNIQLQLNLKKTILNLDSSIPVGLIINELVTNAIKHAFPTNKAGLIIINLTTENNIVFLEIKDNGQGFNDAVDFKNSPSLGLQLVNTLINQIDGELQFETERDKGTKIVITFKM